MAGTQATLMREIALFGVRWAVHIEWKFDVPPTMRRALIRMNRAIIAHQWRVAAPSADRVNLPRSYLADNINLPRSYLAYLPDRQGQSAKELLGRKRGSAKVLLSIPPWQTGSICQGASWQTAA